MEAVYQTKCIVKDSYDFSSYRIRLSESKRKKAAQNRFRALLIVAGILFILSLFVLFASFLTPAKKASAKNDLYETRLVSVKVEQGDSLWSIAEEYYCSEKESIRDFIARIKQNNQLESDTIYPDTYLLIQYSVKK